MATRGQRRVGHRRDKLAQTLRRKCMPAANTKGQPCLEQRRFRAFEQMAPAAICELVKCHGHKGFVSIRPIQIEAFCNLCLASTQLTFQHEGHAAGIAFADGASDRSGALDNAVRACLVARLDLICVKPLNTRVCRHTVHLADHDHPKRAAFLGDRTHREAQAPSRMPHHQARAVAHAPQALGDKCRDILLERDIIHGRNRHVPMPIDCQRQGPGSSQGLDQDL